MAIFVAAHDLSGVGRCSLTAALAVLPAFGHTCYPLPTAILSQQTGLPGYSFLDMTPHLCAYLAGWREIEISPDWIYTGFLGGGKQAARLAELIAERHEAIAAIDPVMGDGGELYGFYSPDFVPEMRRLARCAHILLPNSTEFKLLCGRSGASKLPERAGELVEMALSIDAPRLRAVVVTGALYRGKMCNLIIDPAEKKAEAFPFRYSGSSLSGTGDLFASVFCALAACGKPLSESVGQAADFVSDAVLSMPGDSDPRLGVIYEPSLSKFANSIIGSGF